MGWIMGIIRALIEGVVNFFVKRLEQRDAFNHTKALERMLHASDLIQRAAAGDDNIDRLMLFRSTNGGGAVRVGRPLYAEVYMSSHLPDVPDLEGWDVRRRVDTHYMRMLVEVQKMGVADVRLSTLPKGAVLRGVFESANIVRTTALYVGFANKSFYYLSANHHRDVPLPPASRERLAACVSALREDLSAQDDPTNGGSALRVALYEGEDRVRLSRTIKTPRHRRRFGQPAPSSV